VLAIAAPVTISNLSPPLIGDGLWAASYAGYLARAGTCFGNYPAPVRSVPA
jgi:hypothetical protein